MTRIGVLLLALAGCAMAGKEDQKIVTADSGGGNEFLDAPAQHIDAQGTGSGSGSGSGSGQCTPQQVEVLLNPAFDLGPAGVSWVAAPIDANYPIVTDDSGPEAPLSAPYRAWMGGFVSAGAGQHATDTFYQDVAVPASTTALVLTGSYWVGTDETGGSIYDTADLSLRTTGGSVIEAIQSFDNAHAVGTWTAFNHTFTNLSAGQTVRLFFTTSNDFSNVTSFMFDSLSLKATACP